MEKRVLEITVKDLEANVLLLKKDQKEQSGKLKIKLEQVKKLDEEIDSKTKAIALEASKLEDTRRFLTQKQQEIEAREERSKGILSGLEASIVLATQELKKQQDITSETKYSESQSRKVVESLKISTEALTSKEKTLLKGVKTAEKELEKKEKEVNKKDQKLVELNNDFAIRTMDLRLLERKIKETEKELKEKEFLRDKADNDYKYYMDVLQTKQNDVNIVVKRLEEKYGEAFPNLKLRI